jgi:hypothetical protein
MSNTWQEKFPMDYVNHLHRVYSDHAPILLRTAPETRRVTSFRVTLVA